MVMVSCCYGDTVVDGDGVVNSEFCLWCFPQRACVCVCVCVFERVWHPVQHDEVVKKSLGSH